MRFELSDRLVLTQLLFCLAEILQPNRVDALRVLFATPCFRGHLTPGGGIARALITAGHQVDAWVAGDCCDLFATFANVSQCFPHEHINTSGSIASENQLDGLINCKKLFLEESTSKTFHSMNTFLAANRNNYDVIVHDFLIIGADIAARVHKIPVVCAYIGYANLISPEDDQGESMIYVPESKLPQLIHDIQGVFAGLVWYHYVSKHQFQFIRSVRLEHGLEPVIEDRENDGALPFSYYSRHSVVIHSGPPEMTLKSAEDVYIDNDNFHHIGFNPDEWYCKPLPPELEKFLEKSTKPVVYMSMGTVFQITEQQLGMLLEELSRQTSYSIIWSISLQYDSIRQSGKYLNDDGKLLLVSKIPQFTLLNHGRVQVFITHAGANSMQEAIFAEKPMLVFPGFGDQPLNARRLVNHRVALPLAELTYPEIDKKLGSILEENNYREMKENLKQSKQLMTSLGGYEKSVEVVEKVANGSIEVRNTRELANFIPKCHRFMLIVVLITLLVISFVLGMVFKLVNMLKHAIVGKSKID